jgi:hypothetical protein
MVINSLFAQLGTMAFDKNTGMLNPKTFKPDSLVCTGGGSHPLRRCLFNDAGEICDDIATYSSLRSTLFISFVKNPVMRLGKELNIRVLHPQGVTIISNDSEWKALCNEYREWPNLEDYITDGAEWKGLRLLCDPVLSRSGVNKDDQAGVDKIKAASVHTGQKKECLSSTVALVKTTLQAASAGAAQMAKLFKGRPQANMSINGSSNEDDEAMKDEKEKEDDDGDGDDDGDDDIDDDNAAAAAAADDDELSNDGEDEVQRTDRAHNKKLGKEKTVEGTKVASKTTSAEERLRERAVAWMVSKMVTTQSAIDANPGSVTCYFKTVSGKHLDMEDEHALGGMLLKEHEHFIAARVKELHALEQTRREEASRSGARQKKRMKLGSLLDKEGGNAFKQWLKCKVKLQCGGCGSHQCTKPSYAMGWGYVPQTYLAHIAKAGEEKALFGSQRTVSDLFKKQLLNSAVAAAHSRSKHGSTQQTGDYASESKAESNSGGAAVREVDGTREQPAVVPDNELVSA